MTKRILISVSLAIGFLSFVGWRVIASRRPVPHFGIVVDRSRSHQDVCMSVQGIVSNLLHSPDIMHGSTLTVLATGNVETADEPVRIMEGLLPVSQKAIQSDKAKKHKEQGYLNEVLENCQHAAGTSRSPIFIAIKQEILDLQAKGCGHGAHCELEVDTDGEENVEKAIQHRIEGVAGNNAGVPRLLDNTGIAVDFCGVAVTRGKTFDAKGHELHQVIRRDAKREDRIRSTWTSAFTAPGLVTFAPYCPVATSFDIKADEHGMQRSDAN